jgi:hypothetical protein
MMTTHRILLLTTLLCAAASACAPLGRGVQKLSTNAHEESVRLDHKVRDWFDSEDISGERENLPPEPTTAYCYKTLGQVSCYKQPITTVGYDERFVGSQQPDPVWEDNIYPMPEGKPKPPLVYVDGNTGESVVVQETQDDTPSYNDPRELIPVFEP